MALEKEVYYRGIDTNLDFFDFAETLFRYNNVASVIQEINSSKGSAGYKLYDKAKKFIKEIFQPRFINIVEEEGIDGQTLVNWLWVDVIDTFGRVPEKELKYLGQDLVEAMSCKAVNVLTHYNYSLIKPTVATGRVLNLYAVTSRLSPILKNGVKRQYGYDKAILQEVQQKISWEHIDKTLKSDEQLVQQLVGYLGKDELGVSPFDLKLCKTLLRKLSLSTGKVDSYAHDCIDRLYGQNFCSNIGFITKDEPLGNAQCYTIFFINGVYHNTHLGRSMITRSSEDLGDLHVNICPVTIMYLPSANALAYNTRRGFAGIQSWQRCLQSEDSVARYGSVEKAYRAFESEIVDYITDTQRSYSLGKMLSDASRIKVAKMLAGAKVL